MKNAWLLRAKPGKINRLPEFLERNLIAIGWPALGNLKGKSKVEIKELSSQLSNPQLEAIDNYVNRKQLGD